MSDVAGAGIEADLLGHDAPVITVERAEELAAGIFGVTGSAHPLSSEKDANFRIVPVSGPPALLKITNAAEDRAVTDMQTAALMHLAAVDPALPVPHIRGTLSGEACRIIAGSNGQNHVVRLLTYLEGSVLEFSCAGEGIHRDIGTLLARLALGLRGFFHPAARHRLLWDIKQAHHLRPMLGAIEDEALRLRLVHLLDRFDAEIAPRLPHLRAQILHNDFNPHNLLVKGPGASRITGVIDFGDMVHTPLACDLAVACSYQIADGPAPMAHIAELVGGYHQVLPLEDEEINLLPELIRIRHATSLTIAAWRARRYPENAAYIRRNGEASLRGLNALDDLGDAAVIEILRRATGLNRE